MQVQQSPVIVSTAQTKDSALARFFRTFDLGRETDLAGVQAILYSIAETASELSAAYKTETPDALLKLAEEKSEEALSKLLAKHPEGTPILQAIRGAVDVVATHEGGDLLRLAMGAPQAQDGSDAVAGALLLCSAYLSLAVVKRLGYTDRVKRLRFNLDTDANELEFVTDLDKPEQTSSKSAYRVVTIPSKDALHELMHQAAARVNAAAYAKRQVPFDILSLVDSPPRPKFLDLIDSLRGKPADEVLATLARELGLYGVAEPGCALTFNTRSYTGENNSRENQSDFMYDLLGPAVDDLTTVMFIRYIDHVLSVLPAYKGVTALHYAQGTPTTTFDPGRAFFQVTVLY